MEQIHRWWYINDSRGRSSATKRDRMRNLQIKEDVAVRSMLKEADKARLTWCRHPMVMPENKGSCQQISHVSRSYIYTGSIAMTSLLSQVKNHTFPPSLCRTVHFGSLIKAHCLFNFLCASSGGYFSPLRHGTNTGKKCGFLLFLSVITFSYFNLSSWIYFSSCVHTYKVRIVMHGMCCGKYFLFEIQMNKTAYRSLRLISTDLVSNMAIVCWFYQRQNLLKKNDKQKNRSMDTYVCVTQHLCWVKY